MDRILVRHLLAHERHVRIVNLDLRMYAGSPQDLADLCDAARHTFVQRNIADPDLVRNALDEWISVNHFAREEAS